MPPILTASGMECLDNGVIDPQNFDLRLDHSISLRGMLRTEMSMAPRTNLVVSIISLIGLTCVVLTHWNQLGGLPGTTGTSPKTALTAAAAAAATPAAEDPLFADIDSGACGTLAMRNDDPLVLALQAQLKTDLTPYCIISRTSSKSEEKGAQTLSFKLAEPTEGISLSISPPPSNQHQSPAERAVLSVLSEIYRTAHSNGGGGGSGTANGTTAPLVPEGIALIRRPLPKTAPRSNEPLGKLQPAAWMLDIGTDTGLFTMHAAASGLHVLAFDLQPACIALRHESLNANDGLQPRVRLLNVGLGHRSSSGGNNLTITVRPADHCLGRSSQHDDSQLEDVPGGGEHGSLPEAELRTAGRQAVGTVVSVPVVPLSNFLEGRHVRAMRMSVGGSEVHVLASALELIPTR